MSPSPAPTTPDPSTTRPLNVDPADKDLAEQARPGHGIPSQDPEPAAQTPLTAAESNRESNSVLMGGGGIAGAATGAAVGAVLAGPVGVLVGGTVGLVAGALGGAAAGPLVTAENPASAIPGPAGKEVTRAGETRPEDPSR
ncbi:bacteriocin [Polaromonas sp.]|uniref:bacteriocin n=1 Tax=Polaromonas sp. TaxID=1869339 RepID=UPI0024899212|nr:bacteriocin [Polaromonas sp.]MDI1272238.1 bacteriocin [Polaromonas sp.]